MRDLVEPFFIVFGPIWIGSKRMSYFGSRAMSQSLL